MPHCFLCCRRGARQKLYFACDWALLTLCLLVIYYFQESNFFNTDVACAAAEVRPEALRSLTGPIGNSIDLEKRNVFFAHQ